MEGISKPVLVQLGSHNWIVVVQGGGNSEQEALISAICVTYKIAKSDSIMLQMKDEEWAGAFVDYFQDNIPDRSVFMAIVEKPQVSIRVCCAWPGEQGGAVVVMAGCYAFGHCKHTTNVSTDFSFATL